MAKAEKGDLIRITNALEGEPYENGEIYEVFSVRDVINEHNSDVYIKYGDGGELLVCYDEYEIFRKAGEEDSEVERIKLPLRNEIQNVPSTDVHDAQLTQANRIRSACSELAELLVRKNHDYGDSFSQQYSKYGLMSALIRMDDKMRRLETLQQAESMAQVDESVSDTLLDLAGYALLSYVEQTKTK